MCSIKKFKKHLKVMWFFQSKSLMLASILGILVFIAVNVTIFFHNYDYWIRSYQIVLSLIFWATCIFIVLYWNRKLIKENYQAESDSFKLITAPIIAMTIFMAVGSLLGYLHFIYFKTVFNDCDVALGAEETWETVSDFLFFVTLMVTFVIYPIFIFRCYWNPLAYRWRWLFYLVTTNLVILFIHIGIEEAYHTYAHLCDNISVSKNNLCPTLIEKHHYNCDRSNFTEIQNLWLEMQEQVVGPGIFLIIAEYIPLLFVLIWMAPVKTHRQKTRTSLKIFKESPDESKETISEKEMWASKSEDKTNHQMIGTKQNSPPSRLTVIAVSLSCGVCFVIMILRLGLLLNHVGRYPRFELLLETIGHLVSALSIGAMYILTYFFWLKKHDTKLHRPGEHDEHNEHHMAHARFDAFLLKIASVLITAQICFAGVVELDFSRWLTAFFFLHKIPVIASVWLQYVALKKALTFDCDHWSIAGRRCALVLALAALNANFFEWVAQFIKRRFTVFILDEPDSEISPVVVAAIAISEMLYPALSFYYFHALLCWMVIFWRVLQAQPRKQVLQAYAQSEPLYEEEERGTTRQKRRSKIEDVADIFINEVSS